MTTIAIVLITVLLKSLVEHLLGRWSRKDQRKEEVPMNRTGPYCYDYPAVAAAFRAETEIALCEGGTLILRRDSGWRLPFKQEIESFTVRYCSEHDIFWSDVLPRTLIAYLTAVAADLPRQTMYR